MPLIKARGGLTRCLKMTSNSFVGHQVQTTNILAIRAMPECLET